MPNQAQSLYQQALLHHKENRIAEALPLLEEAIRLEPHFADAYEALGLLYFRLNRLDEAIRSMHELARVDPDHIMAHANLSRFYAAKGLLEEAEKEQAEARRLSWKADLKAKKITPAPQEKSSAEEKQRLLESKIEKYRKVIELDPADVLGYFSLGTAYLEAGQYREAAPQFEKACLVNKDHSPSYLGWGQALESLGLKEAAIAVYGKGIPVADRRGDIIPLKKMQTRLDKLRPQA